MANEGSNTVSVIDYSNSIGNIFYYGAVDNVTVGSEPFAISFNPNTKVAYVANSRSNTINGIYELTTDLIANITVGNRPVGIDINPNTKVAYVANSGSNTVSVINTTTNNVVSNITVGNRPFDIVVSPVTNTIYVANAGSGTIHAINGTANNLIIGIILNINPLNSGNIYCNKKPITSNYVKYNIHTAVECKAEANSGFKFSSWSSNGISNSKNPLEFTADKQRTTFTANFVQSISLDKSLEKILIFLGVLAPVSTVLGIIDAFSKSKTPKIIGGIVALVVVMTGAAIILSY